jgi:xylulokinase
VGRPCVVQGKPHFDSRFINCCHAVPNCWFTLGATDASGLSIKWFRDLFGQQEVNIAQFVGRNPFDLFDEEAAQSPPGAKGIIYLPYLTGERSPIWDPYSRGVLFGLSVSHTRSDVIRAILEGVAYSFLHNLKIYEEELGLKIDQLFLSGGGAKSGLWAQIHADMCNKPVHVVKVKESEALGNAILAGFAVGIYSDMVEVADRVVKIEKIYEPRKESYERYQKLFELYQKLYLHLKEDFYSLSEIMRLG